MVPLERHEEYLSVVAHWPCSRWKVVGWVLALQTDHGAEDVVRGRGHAPAHSEVPAGAAAASAERSVQVQAGSRACRVGSQPSGARHGHCRTS